MIFINSKKVLLASWGFVFAYSFVNLLPMTAQDYPNCESAMNGIEYKRCVYEEFQRADKVLNSVWKQVVSRLSGNEKEQLIDEQLAWIKERDDICTRENPDWTKSTWYRASMQKCLGRVTVQRTETLKGYLR
jgi:uncharacterized protein YecT (DUF1311 family)